MFLWIWIQLLRCSGLLLSITSFAATQQLFDDVGSATVYAMEGEPAELIITLPADWDWEEEESDKDSKPEVYIRHYTIRKDGINLKSATDTLSLATPTVVVLHGRFKTEGHVQGSIRNRTCVLEFEAVKQEDFGKFGCFLLIEDDNKKIQGCGEELKSCNNSVPTFEVTYQDSRELVYDGVTEFHCSACVGNTGSLKCTFVHGIDRIELKESSPLVTVKTTSKSGYCNVHKEFTYKFTPNDSDFGEIPTEMYMEAETYHNTKDRINKREAQSETYSVTAGPGIPVLDVNFHKNPNVVKERKDLTASCSGCVGKEGEEQLFWEVKNKDGQLQEGFVNTDPPETEYVGGKCGNKVTQSATMMITREDLIGATLSCMTDNIPTKRNIKDTSKKWEVEEAIRPCPPGHFNPNACDMECSDNCLYAAECDGWEGWCTNFTEGCKNNYDPPTCTERSSCPQGFYEPPDCETPCSSHCLNMSACDSVNGTCINGCSDGYFPPRCLYDELTDCEEGYHGRDCSSACSIYCLHKRACDPYTGACEGGCVPGYDPRMCTTVCPSGFYGENCEQECSKYCAGNGGCYHVDGKCNEGCTEPNDEPPEICLPKPLDCSRGKWGEDCEKSCSKYCLADPLRPNTSTCHSSTGKCLYGCEAGRWGQNCEKVCPKGTHGLACSERCSVFCAGSGKCSPKDGTCVDGCTKGHYGRDCEGDPCEEGYYGTDCSSACSIYCLKERSCHPDNGACEGGCVPGYYPEMCTFVCPSGFYGENCAQECSQYCAGSGGCYHVDGKCNEGCTEPNDEPPEICLPKPSDCPREKWGKDCEKSCSEFCLVNPIHPNNSLCHSTTGKCLFGCVPGRWGQDCDQICPSGTYGLACSQKCSMFCAGSGECSPEDGTCVDGCTKGRYGRTCRSPFKFPELKITSKVKDNTLHTHEMLTATCKVAGMKGDRIVWELSGHKAGTNRMVLNSGDLSSALTKKGGIHGATVSISLKMDENVDDYILSSTLKIPVSRQFISSILSCYALRYEAGEFVNSEKANSKAFLVIGSSQSEIGQGGIKTTLYYLMLLLLLLLTPLMFAAGRIYEEIAPTVAEEVREGMADKLIIIPSRNSSGSEKSVTEEDSEETKPEEDQA